MVIDIDIKIADSNGKLLQHFVKRFDNMDSTDDRLNVSLDIGKSFEQFLAEYMSYSGRRIQEKLFTDNKLPISDSCYLPEEGFPPSGAEKSGEGLMSGKAEQEIQYLIRIGNGSIFSGKFPVKQLIQVSDIRKTQESEPENSPEAGGEDLNHLIQKAIEKYETTFFIAQEDNTGDFL